MNLFYIIKLSIFILAFFLIAEILCRCLCDFPLLVTSRNLFIINAYGNSIGNAKNSEALCFGRKVYTDEYGFRVPQNTGAYKSNNKYNDAILILGDSIGFGNGVEECLTFSGRLRLNLPSIKIYNSSVIGYNVLDYKNIIDNFLPLHAEISKVYLIFCLNDICSESVQKIEYVLGISKVDNKYTKGFISSIKSADFIRNVNEFLRSRSKFYLLLRHIFTDSQLLFWKADQRLYEEKNNFKFFRAMQLLADMNNLLKKRENILLSLLCHMKPS